MTDNDNGYSTQTNRGSGLLHDLNLMNLARTGVLRDLNSSEQKNQEISKANEELEASLAEEQRRAKAIQNKSSSLEFEVDDLEQSISILQKEVLRLNNLLNQPLVEIAKQHSGFAKKYEEQIEILTEWMVSQKGYKELAIEFGLEKGLSLEDIISQGKKKEIDVLDSKNDSNHNTNANLSKTISPRINKLKEKHLANIKLIQEKSNQAPNQSKFSI